jgi:hypothetical protein
MQIHKHSFNEGHKLHVLEKKFHFIEILILYAAKHVIQCVKKNMGKNEIEIMIITVENIVN